MNSVDFHPFEVGFLCGPLNSSQLVCLKCHKSMEDMLTLRSQGRSQTVVNNLTKLFQICSARHVREIFKNCLIGGQ